MDAIMSDDHPVCPRCNERMVRTRVELGDDWLECWLCGCDEGEFTDTRRSRSNYLIIVRKDEELQRWVVDRDSAHILEDQGGNYPILELQVHTIRAIVSRG